MTASKILLVDDDPGLLHLLALRIESKGYDVSCAESAEQALGLLSKDSFQLVITDLRMDGMDGLAFFNALKQGYPGLPVIMLTAHGSIPEAVEATKQGIFAFLSKPVDKDELFACMEKALSVNPMSSQGKKAEAGIITRNPKMLHLIEQAKLVARTDVNVLIHGESGTGKEVLANAIHEFSQRQAGAFVALNCGALPAELLESELFGHKKGAFTGAIKDHPGLFETANQGSLFLDEIGDMPMALQVKLLRVLQEHKIRPVGASTDQSVDVRVIAATHKDLETMIQEQDFREDLFYRLNVVTLTLPPLRERKEDVPLLAEHFLERIANRSGSEKKQFSPEALQLLMAYEWPGNIRQLQNLIEKSVALSAGDMIPASLIEDSLCESKADELLSLSDAKKAFEREYLLKALSLANGNAAEAAVMVKRNRSDFYKLLKKHHIDPLNFK